MLENAAGLAELRRLGARSVPVLSRGDEYVFAQNIGHVVKFLGLNEATGPVLSPADFPAPPNVVVLESAPHSALYPKAAVVVTHDAHLASLADRVIFLRDGRVDDDVASDVSSASLVTPRA